MRVSRGAAAVLTGPAAALLTLAPALLTPAPAGATVTGPAAPRRWTEQTFTIDTRTDALFGTNAGGLPLAPFPSGITTFTEPELASTLALGTKLRDGTGALVGVATELEEVLPDSAPLGGTLHTRTLWTLILPGRGSITFDQFELTSDSSALGRALHEAYTTGVPWNGHVTARTTEGDSGAIVGGTGEFAGIRGSAYEVDQVFRIDPVARTIDTTVELHLRYQRDTGVRRAGNAVPAYDAARGSGAGRGRPVSRSLFVATPGDLVALTHGGGLGIAPVPATITALTDPALSTSFLLVGKARDAQGTVLGVATELEYLLPESDLPAGRLRSRTLWTLFLPGHGAIVLDEQENQDAFVTTVIAPAVRSGSPWTGDFTLTTTVPGTGHIVGGTGDFAGITGQGTETGHVTRFDPTAGQLVGASEVRLTYRTASR